MRLKLKEFPEFLDKPETTEPYPRNCSINILFFFYKKVVFNLYKKVHVSNEIIVLDICEKWTEKASLGLKNET